MALTPEQKAARHGKIGASFAPALLAGDTDRIIEEWLRLTDHPDYIETDLSDVWAVHFGSLIEPYALDWHERRTGMPLTRRGEWVPHPTLPHIGCTLDAWRASNRTVIDVKAPGYHRSLDDVLAYYAPQMVVQQACTAADFASLLVVHGGAEPHEYAVLWDAEYEAEVWARLAWFWSLVESLQPPSPIPSSTVPVEAVHTVDMSGNNEWGAAAGCWLDTRVAAKLCEASAKTLRSLVQPDTREARGHGVAITRNRGGSLMLKEE